MGGGLSIEMWRAENGSDVVDETLRDRIFGELAELATDFTNVQVVVEDSIATLRFACRLAHDNQAKLFVVHAIPGAEVAPEKYFDADLRQYLEQEARRSIALLQEAAGVAAPLCLGAGEVSHVVRDSALGHSADLIVMGRGKATRALGRLRSNVYSIIRDAPCPVISV